MVRDSAYSWAGLCASRLGRAGGPCLDTKTPLVNHDFLAGLARGPLLGDGGSVFEMERRGYMQAGPYTPEVVLEHPQAVVQMHSEYRRCGADVLQALTFYGSDDKVRKLAELNRRAVLLAREAADGKAFVAGGLSPTPSFRAGASAQETKSVMARHLELQCEAGVDLVIGETFLWLEEALLALQVIKEAGLVAVLTMNLSLGGTPEGHTPAECARRLEDAGADVVGINCSYSPEFALPAALQMKEAVSCPVACQPIAYHNPHTKQPFEQWEDFPLNLEAHLLGRQAMADFAGRASEGGLSFIGGCCGVGPHHLRAMAEALGRVTEASDKSPDLSEHMIPEVRERHR